MIIIRRVVGHSMEPTLKSGQIVLALTRRAPKPGQLVVARLREQEIIKRLSKLNARTVELTSDKPGHHTYKMPAGSIVATVVWPRR